ncbi:MAG: endonuclease [Anaeromyxobacteraceae bacterium]|nr:endonuclease [Anaeromyxobacteraceae bacterium]
MLEELAARAWEIDVPWEPRGVGCGGAVKVDRLLVRVARGHGAVDVALGECLAAMGAGDRALRLGFAGLVDYAREVLGMSGRTALGLSRLARELAERPLLRAAVRRGEVSPRLAQELLPVARGEAEAGWVARAAQLTVREAREAVRAEAAGQGLPDDDWERVEFPADAACRRKVDEAFGLAGELLGATSPRWQRLEAISQEYLGANPAPEHGGGEGGHGGEGGGAGHGMGGRGGDGPGLHELEAALEVETGRWERLLWPEPVAAPDGVDGMDEGGMVADVAAIDARVRELSAMRNRWDDLVGHLGLVVQAFGLWRHLGFASFGHYCAERLGMAERTVAQRVWLERRLHELPGLREAMRQGRVTYEKARLVAGVAAPKDVEAWVAVAERSTCIELRRQVEAGEKAQMCARERVSVVAPRRVAGLFDEACSAVMAREGRWLAPAECLSRMCDHFVEAWEGIRERRRTLQRRVIERDQGFCQVPGCSRSAVHAHHVVWRSRGGGDEPENLVSLCAGHHLHGIHRGYIRVSGRAPDALVWELGEEARAG